VALADWPNPDFCIRVEADGQVSRVRLLESSGDARIDDRIVRVAMDLRFEPARRSGQPTAAWHRVVISRPLGSGAEPASRGFAL